MNQLLKVNRQNTSLRERATQSIRAAILDGVFAPGQKLFERELCEQLGVSRPCLRESLQHLHAEGLISAVPHKSPEVANIDASEVRDIYEVRQSLERIAGSGFALSATEAQRGALRAKLNELKKGVESEGNLLATLPLKNEFYDILIEGCGNLVAGQLLRQLNNRVTAYRRISMSRPGRPMEMLNELEGIVAAIEQRNSHLAGRLCETHVQTAAGHVFQYLETRAFAHAA